VRISLSDMRGYLEAVADSANASVDRLCVFFNVFVVCEIERLAHRMNVAICKQQRAYVRFKTCQFVIGRQD
jgi:hypothetical protein